MVLETTLIQFLQLLFHHFFCHHFSAISGFITAYAGNSNSILFLISTYCSGVLGPGFGLKLLFGFVLMFSDSGLHLSRPLQPVQINRKKTLVCRHEGATLLTIYECLE